MESCPLVVSQILAEFCPERVTYTALQNGLFFNGSNFAQNFTDGFLKLFSTHPIHIACLGKLSTFNNIHPPNEGWMKRFEPKLLRSDATCIEIWHALILKFLR